MVKDILEQTVQQILPLRVAQEVQAVLAEQGVLVAQEEQVASVEE